jgi:hypothetical protein
VPEQTGSAPITGPVGTTGSPHVFNTVGGVGIICASTIQGTFEPSSTGSTKAEGIII